MNFLKFVSDNVTNADHVNAGVDWWNRLHDEAQNPNSEQAVALQNNISVSQLFPNPEDSTGGKSNACDFCEELANIVPQNPIKDVSEAITRSGAMICGGPKAQEFGSDACSLLSVRTFADWCTNRGRGRMRLSFVNRIWNQLGDLNKYGSFTDKSTNLRGNLPYRFWTAIDDISNLGPLNNVTSSRLGQYLGLDWDGRSLLIAIESGKEPYFSIPTGWDGFTNPYFKENTQYDQKDSSTHFGYTLDLANQTRAAREVVSDPVSLADTKLVGRFA